MMTSNPSAAACARIEGIAMIRQIRDERRRVAMTLASIASSLVVIAWLFSAR